MQITQIGLDAYNDHSEMVAWATDLKDGSPLADVRIQPGNGSAAVLSGADGVARFKYSHRCSLSDRQQGRGPGDPAALNLFLVR